MSELVRCLVPLSDAWLEGLLLRLLMESCGVRHLLAGGEIASGHLCYRVIVGHADLPIVLVIFTIADR